jgi:hypothetical protein
MLRERRYHFGGTTIACKVISLPDNLLSLIEGPELNSLKAHFNCPANRTQGAALL